MKIKQSIFLFFLFIILQNVCSQEILPISIIEKEISIWEYRMVGDSIWKPAKVPGTVIGNLVDLSDNSNLLHPYYGDNEKLYQWVAEKDWEFRTNFELDSILYKGCHFELLFEQLDLFADIYINNELHCSSNNSFSPLICHVGNLPLSKPIELRILFHSTPDSLKILEQNNLLKLPGGERVFARKPQYEFGWDWAPRFINMGIRKSVKLKIYPPKSVNLFVQVVNKKTDDKFSGFRVKVSLENPYAEYNENKFVEIGPLQLSLAVLQNGEMIHQ